jgi:hypothetical protein
MTVRKQFDQGLSPTKSGIDNSAVRKKFSQELYNEHNDRAINAVIREFEEAGLFATRNDDRYGPDVVVYKGFQPTYYVEVEVKLAWKPDTVFPFDTIHLPERKAKFLNLGLPIEFWILRSDLKESLVLPEHIIHSSNLTIVPNRYIEAGEQFFNVPVSECIHKLLGSDDVQGTEETSEEMGKP